MSAVRLRRVPDPTDLDSYAPLIITRVQLWLQAEPREGEITSGVHHTVL